MAGARRAQQQLGSDPGPSRLLPAPAPALAPPAEELTSLGSCYGRRQAEVEEEVVHVDGRRQGRAGRLATRARGEGEEPRKGNGALRGGGALLCVLLWFGALLFSRFLLYVCFRGRVGWGGCRRAGAGRARDASLSTARRRPDASHATRASVRPAAPTHARPGFPRADRRRRDRAGGGTVDRFGDDAMGSDDRWVPTFQQGAAVPRARRARTCTPMLRYARGSVPTTVSSMAGAGPTAGGEFWLAPPWTPAGQRDAGGSPVR